MAIPAPRLPGADASWWQRYELPTFVMAAVLYGCWAALVWWHASIPGWLLFILGGYVTQWHFSLQHESIHAMRRVPAWLRVALVFPPLGMWFPYPMYNRSHSTHHVNYNLTHPTRDTESNYHLQQAWPGYGRWTRAVYRANQTLLVRLVFGPFIRLWKMAKRETARIRARDYSNLPHWAIHAMGVGLLFAWITGVAGMRWWEYLLYFVYPGMMLGMLRTFTEHRFGERPNERTAIVESNPVMGLLFLFNNLHLIHHRSPTLPWYEIPDYYRRHRAQWLRMNDQFYYRGYAQIAWRHLLRPVFSPIHPKW